MSWLTAARRRALYAAAVAATALLVIYRIADAEQSAGWLRLVDAILGILAPTVALAHVTPDDPSEDGGA